MKDINKKNFFRVFGVLFLCVSVLMILAGLFTPLSFVILALSGVILLSFSIVLLYLSRNNRNLINKQIGFEDRIRQLESLRADDLISNDEYETKRAQIMNENW